MAITDKAPKTSHHTQPVEAPVIKTPSENRDGLKIKVGDTEILAETNPTYYKSGKLFCAVLASDHFFEYKTFPKGTKIEFSENGKPHVFNMPAYYEYFNPNSKLAGKIIPNPCHKTKK